MPYSPVIWEPYAKAPDVDFQVPQDCSALQIRAHIPIETLRQDTVLQHHCAGIATGEESQRPNTLWLVFDHPRRMLVPSLQCQRAEHLAAFGIRQAS